MPVTEIYVLVPHFFALRALVREIIPNTNSYIPTPTYPATHKPTSYMTEIGISSIVRLRLFAFGAQYSSELVMACLATGMIQSGAMPFAVFANCPSSELRVGCCQYSRAFLLWALLILAVSRAARWLEVAPRWYGA